MVQSSPYVLSILWCRSRRTASESACAVLRDGAGAVGDCGVNRLGWTGWLGSRGRGAMVAGGDSSGGMVEVGL